jgi:CubicO group peptidase (beta-lactamase class C family)
MLYLEGMQKIMLLFLCMARLSCQDQKMNDREKQGTVNATLDSLNTELERRHSVGQINLDKHSNLNATPEKALPLYSLITYPDGGLITSAEDLGKFLSELIRAKAGEGRLLNKESYLEYFRPQLEEGSFESRNSDNDFNDEYNMGVFMGITPKGYIGHTGGDPGITTLMFFDPIEKTGDF